MLIHRIQILNFKNFEQIDVPLGNVNVMVGANASGKSNLIQALKFIRDIKDYGIENALSRQGGIEFFRNFQLKAKKSSISIEWQPGKKRFIKNTSSATLLYWEFCDVVYTIEINLNRNKKPHILTEKIEYTTAINECRFESIEQKTSANQEDVLTVVKSLGEYKFTLMCRKGNFSFDSTSKGNKIKVILSDNTEMELDIQVIIPFLFHVDYIADIAVPQKTLLEQFSFLLPPDSLNFAVYDFDLKKAKEATSIIGKAELEENGENLAIVIKNILEDKEKARQFSNLLSDILPYVSDVGVDKFYNKSLLFKVREIYNNHAHLPGSLLSDGTIAVTAMIAALFFETKSLAVFEEPEKGIHPALIAKLVQYFYDAAHVNKKQFIITTHSPEVLKHTHLEDLILVSRNEHGFGQISKPAEQAMVKAFLESELGIEQLFTQNLLDT